MEEETVVADLRRAGYYVSECLKNQKYFDFGSHVGGSPDGVICGLPQSPRKLHTLEIKTHSKKSFDKLVRDGVEKSKPMHFVQMQCYMHARKTDRALYYAVCKDDDNVYTERLHYNAEIAEKYIARAKRITLSERIPAPLSTDPTWYECRFCAAYNFCFDKKIPDVNCRTCAHSTPEKNGTWTCARYDRAVIPSDAQYLGCRAHVIHPDMTDAKITEYNDWSCYYDGALVGEDGMSSLEFLHAEAGLVAEKFGGKIL